MAKRKKLYISFSTRILIFGILFAFGIIMAIALFIGATDTNIEYLAATSSAKIDYKVYLKENNFYDEKVLKSDMSYVATLIDYIDTDFEYTIASTNPMDYNYTYSIEAITRVYGDNNKTKVLLEKSNILLKDKTLTVKDTDIVSIKENIKIDYDEYNMLIASFKTSYALNSISDVSIILHVTSVGKNDSLAKDVIIEEQAELVIPLTEQTIDVEMTKNPGYTYDVIDKSKKVVVNHKSYLAFSLVFIVLAIISFVKLLKMKIKVSAKSSKYTKTLKRILREYDLIIANVEHTIDETNYEVIEVSSFEELKDVHDNIGNPILYKEIHKNQKCSFIIVKDNFLYKYVLKSIDLEKKNNKK